MNENSSNIKKWITCAVIFFLLICITIAIIFGINAINNDNSAQIVNYQDPTVPPLNNPVPFEAVVQILALYEEDGEMFVGWTGSGSIISPDGLILTNAHVVLPDRYFNVDALAIAITLSDDRPPEILYIAEVIQANEALDIAVIQIIEDADFNPIDPEKLNLPYVPLGDSSELRLGDEISILGYPSIGGETITLTSGEVSGFTTEIEFGDRAFIKTSATIAGGNSGGLATDSDGKLIGIPTQLGYGGDGQFVDCRVLEDTNRDGRVDENDSCIPTGGFINALRPIRLALPLIEAAKRGEVSINYIEMPTKSANIPESGRIIYQDNFSDADSGWGYLESESGSSKYANGKLQIEVIEDNYLIWSTPEKTFNEVIVTVDVDVINPIGDGDFGILCGYQDINNYHALEISEDGYFSIWKFHDGEFIMIVDWQSSSMIPAPGNPYTLTAACVGDALSIAVNGNLLAEASDPEYSNGDIGLIIGTLDQTGIIVTFDNLVVADYTP